MQEAARDVAAVERLVDLVAGEHQRQRQVAAADALREAEEVRPHAGLLAGEEGAGASAADRDLVEDQVHAVAVAQRAHQLEVERIVHRHAGGALHQRLDDEGGDVVGALGEQGLQVGGGAAPHVLGVFALARVTRVGRGHHARGAQQRAVGVLEQGHVGDGQRADGLAVVAALQADEFALVVLAAVAPGVKAHLERDLHRRGAVGGVEGMPEHIAGHVRQLLRQAHHRFMGEAGQHRVLELVELVLQRRVDARVGVAEQVDPPGADRVQVAFAVVVVQPGAAPVADRDQGHAFVVLHLGARVPHTAQAARYPILRHIVFHP